MLKNEETHRTLSTHFTLHYYEEWSKFYIPKGLIVRLFFFAYDIIFI